MRRASESGFSSDRLNLESFNRWDGKGHAVCLIDGKWGMDWNSMLVLATGEAL